MYDKKVGGLVVDDTFLRSPFHKYFMDQAAMVISDFIATQDAELPRINALEHLLVGQLNTKIYLGSVQCLKLFSYITLYPKLFPTIRPNSEQYKSEALLSLLF